MRRTPRREERYTVLAVGEGSTEVAFLSHVKSLYHTRGRRSVTIESGRGGSPEHVIEWTLRHASPQVRAYRRVVIWLDCDQVGSEEELARLRQLAGRHHLLVSRPCVEGFLLGLLEPDRDWARRNTAEVLRHFHRRYLDESAKCDRGAYGSIAGFGRGALDACRALAKERQDCASLLDALIREVFEAVD